MLIKKRRRRLTLELVMMTLISLIAGVLTAQLVEDMGIQLMLNKLQNEDYYDRQTEDCLNCLQGFIEENQVTQENIELLASWAQMEKNVYVVFYQDVDALFSTTTIPIEEDAEIALNGSGLPYYDVTLSDGTLLKAELEMLYGQPDVLSGGSGRLYDGRRCICPSAVCADPPEDPLHQPSESGTEDPGKRQSGISHDHPGK